LNICGLVLGWSPCTNLRCGQQRTALPQSRNNLRQQWHGAEVKDDDRDSRREKDVEAMNRGIIREFQCEFVKIGKQRSQEVHEYLFEFLNGCALKPFVAKRKV
jgi:hypothetical protein